LCPGASRHQPRGNVPGNVPEPADKPFP